jgi:hypothetical protein
MVHVFARRIHKSPRIDAINIKDKVIGMPRMNPERLKDACGEIGVVECHDGASAASDWRLRHADRLDLAE